MRNVLQSESPDGVHQRLALHLVSLGVPSLDLLPLWCVLGMESLDLGALVEAKACEVVARNSDHPPRQTEGSEPRP